MGMNEEVNEGDGRLPVEVWHMVWDALLEGTTFEEYFKLGQICQGWRMLREEGFEAWIQHQTEGVCLHPFSGRMGEMVFLRSRLESE